MIKKIGILTFHNVFNYGALLQAYCLVNALKDEFPDYKIEIINAIRIKNYLNEIRNVILTNHLGPVLTNLVKFIKMRRFVKKNLPLSKLILYQKNDKGLTSVKKLNYDMIIVGSDEVWKIRDLNDFPNIYWLYQKLDAKKVSYAASANRTKQEILKEVHFNRIGEILKSFKYITVRDETTLEIIKRSKIDNDVEIVPDPTVIYDIPKIDLKNKLQKSGVDFTRKRMAIMGLSDKLCKRIYSQYSKEYQICTLVNKHKYSDLFFGDLSPIELFSSYQFFNIVLTNYFHGTIFCIKNNVPFVSIDEDPSYLNNISKIEDLLIKLNLKENYIKFDACSYSELFNKIDQTGNKKPLDVCSDELKKCQLQFESFKKKIKSLL